MPILDSEMKAVAPFHHESRLEALYRYGILDTPVEADFDELTALASQICEAPISTITFVDRERQWFKSEVGQSAGQTPIEWSICAHAIEEPDFCLIPDTREDSRFAANPLVHSEPGLRFYAGAVLRCPEGHALGTLCVMDHRPRKLAEFQLNSLRLMARNVEQLLEIRRQAEAHRQISIRLESELELRKNILGMVSHDLRTPLSSIHLVTHLAEKEIRSGEPGADEMLDELVEILKEAVSDMTRLVGDLADFSMSEQGRLPMRFAECDAVEVLASVERRFRLAAVEAGITLHTEDASGDRGHVHGDAQRLSQALGNLVFNALKFTPSGGEIFLRLSCTEAGVEFSVRDTGKGMPTADLERIFERYWTAGDKKSGRGLGLEITQGIISAHKGSIVVESEEGTGTVFTITLPATIQRGG